MQTSEYKRDKVVLAYSGGLDTSVAIRWLQENYDLDVIAVSIDVGQPPRKDDAVARAKKIGAVSAYSIDAKEEFVGEYIFPSLRANAMYQGTYPLSTAIARPLIVKTLVDVAKREGAKYIAHGCTAKGNDQVRFDVGIMSLDPSLGIIAPMREWKMSRDDEIEYAREKEIPIIVKKESPFSTDENLWGRSCECGVLEDPWQEPPEEAYEWTSSVKDAPDDPEYIEIEFINGVPVSLNGELMDGVSLIQKINAIAGKHGVGRIDHVEDRLVGLKSREVYECPAAITLIKAHQSLEGLVLTRDLLSFKHIVEQRFSEVVYDGLWFGPLRESLDAFIDQSQEFVTGIVRVRLHKGNAVVVGRKSPFSLYDEGLATYAEGDEFDHDAARGFIYCWGLPNKTVARVQRRDENGQ
ncbi:MAG: argininosuccinate synthase [Candidatus Methanomethylophilaceae archaeon]|nr:argininosuccinate synthase [Candidatus Methanomethylophilaceae archaeon]